MATNDPLAMLLDAARYIESEKPAWAKAAREAVATARQDAWAIELNGELFSLWLTERAAQKVVESHRRVNGNWRVVHVKISRA